MSIDSRFTKQNLNNYLSELAKEFRKLNGASMPAEIVLIGGASILANYGFRESTYDVDAVIRASSVMKEAINRVSDKMNLPNGWLNTDFKTTKSYSDKLIEVSIYYKTFSNILTVRTVTAEYLIAMKLMSGRQYKNDLSDIVGILLEHEKEGKPIAREVVEKAILFLYGENSSLPKASSEFLENIFNNGNLENIYNEIKESENNIKEILLEFDDNKTNSVKEGNIDSIIAMAKKMKNKQ